jgi:serine/threonine protein kinase
MICCLNPNCTIKNFSYHSGTEDCSCGTKLVPLSHYIPVSKLGEGQYGVTYKAEDIHKNNENCAIKQLIVHNDAARDSFKKESEHLQKLNIKRCSKIPEMFSYIEEGKYLYLIQEFIDGKNLAEYLKEKDQLDEREVRELLNQLLPVIKILHEEGIIHRDIKPDNIMRRVNGEYVLIDFGISKQLTGHDVPTPGTNVGTEGYAPKEQREDNITKESSDLYSLGVVCYELLTGKNPRDALMRCGYSWTNHWAQCLDRKIDSNLSTIIDKLLKSNYSDRYQTAEDVLKDLNPLSSPELPSETEKYNRETAKLTLVSAKWGIVGQVIAFITAVGIPTAILFYLQKPLTADEYYRKGQELDGRDSKEAIEAYTKAIKIDEKYTEAYISRGISRRDYDDNENALKDFTKAIELNPESSVSYAYRGLTFNDLSKTEKAEKDFTKVFKIEPNNSADYNAIGLALSDIPKNKEAIKAYDEAIDYNPKFWRAYINRGMSKHRLGQYKQAVEDYNKAIALNPNSASAYLNRGISKFALKDTDGAIKDYTQVIKIKPNSSSAYYQRGFIKGKSGEKKDAISDYTEAAKIFVEKSDFKRAKEATEQANKLK